jgi:hypothetical protein
MDGEGLGHVKESKSVKCGRGQKQEVVGGQGKCACLSIAISPDDVRESIRFKPDWFQLTMPQ